MSPLQKTYHNLYIALSNLREHLHLSGRIDDSNAKLDEVSKILAICIAIHRGWIESKEFDYLIKSSEYDKKATDILSNAFELCSNISQFKNNDGSSIFGASPTLNIQQSDNDFALLLARTIFSTFVRALKHASSNNSFDLVNEAFGHFIRDNFRGNIEDAQYMTPPEVVDFMCEWAIAELENDDDDFKNKRLTVIDPSCGVGSFLASFHRKMNYKLGKLTNNINLVGQDKVDRMVRLSKINLMLFGSSSFDIDQGNSLIKNKRLESYNGKVDLILTNPPFGAKISSAQINQESEENYPLFHGIFNNSISIDSELAFIDRDLALLREGGKLFIIVPDSAISSRGLAETLRVRLIGVAKLKGVVELPAVTFAQAGTRTKTSILYLEKGRKSNNDDFVTMASIDDLGFQVSIRKGVTIKKHVGFNQLNELGTKLFYCRKNRGIISTFPSCTVEFARIVENNVWTASHYSARKLLATEAIASVPGTEPKKLKELVTFETKKRKRLNEVAGSKCISVRHIIGDGIIDFKNLLIYKPKTKGNVCYPDDILISKINPRIPRIIVVPKLRFPTTCSNEFEIVRTKDRYDPFWLCFILLEDLVQDQIQSLTSGTSSSHNRIKTEALENILIPVPKIKSKWQESEEVVSLYKDLLHSASLSLFGINDLRKKSLMK